MLGSFNPRSVILILVMLLRVATNYEIAKAQTPSPPYQVRVFVDTAKLRTGPGTNFPSNGYVNKGEILSVHQISSNGEWLLVYQNPELWISNLQVEVVGEGNIINVQPTLINPGLTDKPNSTSQIDPVIQNSGVQNFLDPTSLLLSTSFTAYFLGWIICVLVPLIFGFHWRWSIGSFFACLFWGPIGLIFALYVSWLVVIRSHKISTYSPRALMEEFASNPVITIVLGIALIGLTAISILGGFIVIGIIYFYFQFSLLFMPSGTEQPAYTYAPLTASGSASTSITSYNDDYSSSNHDYNRSYDEDRYNDEDDDDDDDDENDDKGSVWDGWLVKW